MIRLSSLWVRIRILYWRIITLRIIRREKRWISVFFDPGLSFSIRTELV